MTTNKSDLNCIIISNYDTSLAKLKKIANKNLKNQNKSSG